MVTLYDANGRKVQRQKLREEEAAPSIRSIRQVVSGYPSIGVTPQRLARIMMDADQGDPHAQCELFEEMEEKDLHISSVLGTRKRAVAGLEIKIEPPKNATKAEDKATELVRDHIDNIKDFPEKLMDILDAIGKGFSATEIIWGIYKSEAVIEDLRWREPKWFRFDQDTMSELRLVDPAYQDGKPLRPYKFIVHYHKAKSGIPVRGGILRPCAWMYLFKNYDFKDWVTFAEVYGQPLRIGKYPASASEQEKDVLLRAVASMGSDAAAIIPDSMLIDFVDASGKTGSTDLYERLARFCDEQVSKGVLGQTSSSDAMAGGLGSGQANLHGEVREDLLRADARQLGGTLSRDLIRPIVDLNLGAQDRYPTLKLLIEDPEDLKELGENTERLYNMGLPIEQDWLYAKFNIPKPKDGADTLPYPDAGQPEVATNAQQEPAPVEIDNDAANAIASQLEDEAMPVTDKMIDQVKELMDEVDSLEELADRLPALLGDLDTSQLTELMAKAFATAELAGQHDAVRQSE